MMLWMRTFICGIAIGAAACSDSIAQDDASLAWETPPVPVDSVQAPLDSLRIRAELTTAILDSLWTDSLWVWSGECPGSVMLFRIESRDGWYKELTCSCEESENIESEAPSSASDPTALPAEAAARYGVEPVKAKTYHGQIQWDRHQLASLPSIPNAGSCFPPLDDERFDRILQAVDALPFELGKCNYMKEIRTNHCFSVAQVEGLLGLIASEDRRLEVLRGFIPSTHGIRSLHVESLFHLRLFQNQAMELIR